MTDSPVTHTPKMQAFMEMQKMRRVSVTHDISEEQRAIVIDHKYGRGLTGSEAGSHHSFVIYPEK